MSDQKIDVVTPELDKLSAVRKESQAIGEFLEEFLPSKGIFLATTHKHTDACYTEGLTKEEFQKKYKPTIGRRRHLLWGDEEIPEDDWQLGRHSQPKCDLLDGQMLAAHYSVEKLLAEFFEIGLDKVEAERMAILEALRKQA